MWQWKYLLVKKVTPEGILVENEKKETIFIKKQNIEETLLEEIKRKILENFYDCDIVLVRKKTLLGSRKYGII